MFESFSAIGFLVHTPCGPRKSGMPESVEMPAPVSATTRLASSIQRLTFWTSAAIARGLARLPGQALDRGLQLLGVEGLDEVGARTLLDRPVDALVLGRRRYHHDRDALPAGRALDIHHQVDAGGVRQAEVERDEPGHLVAGGHRRLRGFAVGRMAHAPAVLLEHGAHPD